MSENADLGFFQQKPLETEKAKTKSARLTHTLSDEILRREFGGLNI